MVDTQKINGNLYLIDAQLFSFPKFGSVYLMVEKKMALVETGCANSAGFVLDGIRQLGFAPEDISYIIVTHIHLDHAGAAGILLRDMPQAQVVVHELGAKHLVDPSKLENSMIKSLGERMLEVYGKVTPINAERVHPVKDGDIIELSQEQKLKIIHSPGHAPHHICIYESRNRGLFTGDAVGVYFPEEEVLIPTAPPPDINVDIWLNTLDKLKELSPDRLYFSHFGTTAKVKETMQLSIKEHQTWADVVRVAMREGNFEHVVSKLGAQAAQDLKTLKDRSLYEYLMTNYIPWGAAGIMKYYL